MTTRLALLAATLAVAGCQSTPEAAKRPVYEGPPYGLDNRIEVDFEDDWEDIEISRTGDKNAGAKAFYVTQRKNAALRCLKTDPPCLLQAIELVEEVLKHVPEASEPRFIAAQAQYRVAAYWFRFADVLAWNMQFVEENRRSPQDEYGDHIELDDDMVEGLLNDYRPWLKKANAGVTRAGNAALKHFEIYQRLHPEDKAVHEYVWRLFFFLQRYDEALDWLSAVMARMERQEIDSTDPIRVRHAQVKKAMEDYLANLKLNGQGEAIRADVLTDLDSPEDRR